MSEQKGSTPRDDSYVWAPLSIVINVLTALVVFPLIIFVLLLPVTALGGSSFGFGDDIDGKVCATASDFPVHQDAISGVGRPESGVGVYPKSALVCEDRKGLENPVGVYALKVLTELPTALVYVGFLFGVRRMMNRTDERGLFDRDTARQISKLGWWLLGGLVVAALLESLAASFLLESMLLGQPFWAVDPSISKPALLGALGIVCIGRVMSRASTLQDEVDGTV